MVICIQIFPSPRLVALLKLEVPVFYFSQSARVTSCQIPFFMAPTPPANGILLKISSFSSCGTGSFRATPLLWLLTVVRLCINLPHSEEISSEGNRNAFVQYFSSATQLHFLRRSRKKACFTKRSTPIYQCKIFFLSNGCQINKNKMKTDDLWAATTSDITNI